MKIKPLTKEQIILSVDRLTRFKETETKYLRVFKEIITNNLIEPKFKKSELDEMDYKKIADLAEQIINFSLKETNNNFLINQRLIDYENSIFNLDSNVQKLLENKINYSAIIKLLGKDIPNNLKFLKSLELANPEQERIEHCFCFPLKKLVICEGITEETLLPEFAKQYGYNFDQNGVYVISAGGKNQVVKYFYKYVDCIKIPIFVLLDKDAQENLNEIKPKLRKIDKIHILKSGEFEDLLPNSLISKTLKYATQNISMGTVENIENYSSKVEFLEEFFFFFLLHEFKKADFAQLVKENINSEEEISEEIEEIIKEIKGTKVPL